jgi:methylphosphotriester-DNA--protein-cysteine methyltransferase
VSFFTEPVSAARAGFRRCKRLEHTLQMVRADRMISLGERNATLEVELRKDYPRGDPAWCAR